MDTSKVFLVKRGVPPSVDYGHQEKDGQITLPFSFVTVGKLYFSKIETKMFSVFLCTCVRIADLPFQIVFLSSV